MSLPKLILLDRYFLGKIVPTMLLTLMVAAVILMLDKLLALLDLTIGNGVSAFIAIKMMFSMVPNYLRLVLPLGLFLGVMFAFRGLSANSEFHVMQSSGISLWRMNRAALALALIGLIFSFALVGYGEPLARYIYNLLYFDVTNGVIESGIGEGIFVKIPGSYTIRVQESREEGRRLFGVFVERENKDGTVETFTAKQGQLTSLDSGDIVLRLLDGEHIEWTIDKPERRVVRFDTFDLPFDLNTLLHFRERGADERELTLDELVKLYITNFDAKPDATVVPSGVPQSAHAVAFTAIAAEIHERIAYALSILFMPLFAAPLGLTSPRSMRFAGPSVGVLGLVAYQKTLEFVGKGAAVGKIPAGLSIWAIYLLFAGVSVWLFVATARSTGVTPFSRFEDMLAEIARAITIRFASKRGTAPA